MLTEYERKTLELLRDYGPYMNTSSVGYDLFTERKKQNPSPQGMALAAGRYLGPLSRRKLVCTSGRRGWAITTAGVELLASLNR